MKHFELLLRAELAKLAQARAWAILAFGPALLAVAIFLMCLALTRPFGWMGVLMEAGRMWTMLVYPLTMVLFCLWYAQLENRDRNIAELHLLPITPTLVYLAKGSFVVAALALTQLVYSLLIPLAAWVGARLNSSADLTGPIAWAGVARTNCLVWASLTAASAIQFWVSQRSRGVALPLIVGFAGITLAVGAALSGRDTLNAVPWYLPYRVLLDPLESARIAGFSVLAGMTIFALSIWDLSRREIT